MKKGIRRDFGQLACLGESFLACLGFLLGGGGGGEFFWPVLVFLLGGGGGGEFFGLVLVFLLGGGGGGEGFQGRPSFKLRK